MREKTGNGRHVDLEQLLEDIKVVVRDGQELLRAGMTTVKEQARARAETTSQLVRERPYQSVGLAFGLGVLVGALALGLLRRGAEEEEE